MENKNMFELNKNVRSALSSALGQDNTEKYIATYGSYLPEEKLNELTVKLNTIVRSGIFESLEQINYLSPSKMTAISATVGFLGVDSFMLGDTKRGVLKLCTLGGLFVLAIIDAVKIKRKVKQINYEIVKQVIENYSPQHYSYNSQEQDSTQQ